MNPAALPSHTPIPLPRGGQIVITSLGPIQFGIPPETIKDTSLLSCGVPQILVVGNRFFSYSRGINLADVEFPIFFNFFIRKQKCVIICTEEQRERVKAFMQESMFGPETVNLEADVQGDPSRLPWCPDLQREMDHFSQNPFKPGHRLTYDDFVEFVTYQSADDTARYKSIALQRQDDDMFCLTDTQTGTTTLISQKVRLPPLRAEPVTRRETFRRPTLGVTVLGRGHGFDPNTKTTGLLLWTNGRGILVDPPVDSTEYLKDNEIPSRATDAIILTHCHADHCAGTLQKVLQADRVRLYTTPTIYESFLRKSAAITNLPIERFEHILDYRPLPIRQPVFINGAKFIFNYNLHSIPCIRIEAWLGDKSLVYSSDTLNDPEVFEQLRREGVLSDGRAQDLDAFPWNHDLVIHEAGVPPIHTSTRFLGSLDQTIKDRLYIVHTTQSAIPDGSGLRLAPLGLENTLQLTKAKASHRDAVEWVRAMRSVDHFQNMSAEKVEEFLEVVEYREVKAGEDLIRMGDEGNEFFMILSGKCAIYQGEVARKVFGMYDYFGETALVNHGRRTADVTAISDMELLVMHRHASLTSSMEPLLCQPCDGSTPIGTLAPGSYLISTQSSPTSMRPNAPASKPL